jgi:hypothetical protein
VVYGICVLAEEEEEEEEENKQASDQDTLVQHIAISCDNLPFFYVQELGGKTEDRV